MNAHAVSPVTQLAGSVTLCQHRCVVNKIFQPLRRSFLRKAPVQPCIRAASSSGSDSFSGDQWDLQAAVNALESALARSAEALIEEDDSTEGLPVWCHGNAMLPGFREVLGVHKPWLIAMFKRALGEPKPWRYVHFSNSSSFSVVAEASKTVQELYRPSQPRESAIWPEADPMRPAIGTMMEVVVADISEDGRLFLAVRALGAVQLKRVVQRTPYVRAVVEWRPDLEEVDAAGGAAPAVCTGEIWATNFECRLDPSELTGVRPLDKHLVEVAREFHEVAPPSGDAAATAGAAEDAARWVSTPSQRSLAAASATRSLSPEATVPVFDAISKVEEMQEAIAAAGLLAGQAPSPYAARAMRPLVSPPMARALEPILCDSNPEWPVMRRMRWLSYALAAMLPEIAMGPGRQALLEAPSVAERLALCFRVLAARCERLSALLALQGLQGPAEPPEAQRESSAEVREGAHSDRDKGISIEEAAKLERLAGGWTLHLDEGSGALKEQQREKRRKRRRWLQQRAIQEAAECTLQHGGDDSQCQAEWQVVKDLSDRPSSDDEFSDPPERR
uniref:Uncharacterized protein n=1 Tax=Tetraselmis sp. GSL018 TaxID=582737 RepID=A0A061S792_9CHLO